MTGDVALGGCSADPAGANPKGFAFARRKNVDAGATIDFTDNGWRTVAGPGGAIAALRPAPGHAIS